MNPKNLIFLLLGYAAIAFVVSCERDWNNPWDEFNNLSPEAWAPQNLQIEDVTITEKKLTWTYGNQNIEGFKIDRKKGDEAWRVAYQTFPKETRNWSDTEIIPNPSLTYEYRVYAFAGKLISAQSDASSVADFAAPSSLMIEKLTDKSYKLTWTDNSTGEQGFKIDRKIDEGNWATAFGTVAANQTTFTDTNVFRATSVEYRVYGFFEGYESGKVTVAASAELTAPSDLLIEKLSDKSCRLTWTDNSNGEEGFKIDRRVDNETWATAYGKVTSDQVSFVDTNVFRAVNIEYQVYAFAGNAESQKIAANTNTELTAPTNLAIIQNSITSVTLNWQDNSSGEDGFRLDRKYEGGDWQFLTTTKNSYFEDGDFELNTRVYYRVSAFVGQYNSSFSEKDFDSQIPAPTNLIITNNSITKITLSWQDNSNGEEGFKIYRKYDSGNWELFATIQSNQLIDNNFELNRQVFYRVFSYFGQSNSNYLDGAFYSTIPAPTNLQITPNSITSVTLTWQDNSNGEDGFKVERKYEGGNWEQISLTTLTSYQDNSFQLNTQVYYRVCAYIDQYNSTFVEKNFDSSVPSPSNLQITQNTISSVTLSWQDNSNGEEGFKIDRKYAGGNWEQINTTTVNSYQDNSFQLNTQVYFRICAYVGEFNSGFAEKDFNSQIPPPSNLQIVLNSVTSVTLTWQENINGEEGFKIDRKLNSGVWESNYATVNSNQTSFADDNLYWQSLSDVYYYRVYAFVGQYNSNVVENSVICSCGFFFTDPRDNNVYETVKIGNQCWMKENLSYLPNVSPSANGSQTSPYYYVFDYQGTNVVAAKATSNYQTYGALYNWPASLSACPDGWHLSSDDEWSYLTNYLGGVLVSGGKMKETGLIHWQPPNTGATNSSGFTGLPGGSRFVTGSFNYITSNGLFWTSNENLVTEAWERDLYFDDTNVYRGSSNKSNGFSVRCLKD